MFLATYRNEKWRQTQFFENGRQPQSFTMEDDLIFLENVRWPYLFGKCKITFFIDLIQLQFFFSKGRHPQYTLEWKTTWFFYNSTEQQILPGNLTKTTTKDILAQLKETKNQPQLAQIFFCELTNFKTQGRREKKRNKVYTIWEVVLNPIIW